MSNATTTTAIDHVPDAVWASLAPLPDLARAERETLPHSDALKGLRLGVKDLFHIAGLPTAAGNPDWLATHPVPAQSNRAVLKLLAAGAQFVGKTQTDELAYSLNGTNVHYGTPQNPRDPARLPGGSSSGSAVATAANLIDIGLGTDTGGSIRVPASYNGLFGLRTSHGAIACDAMVPLAPDFDTVGWMTRDLDTLIAVGEVLLPQLASSAAAPVKKSALRIGVLEPEILGEHLWGAAQEAWLSNTFSEAEFTRIPLPEVFLSEASQTFRTLQARNIWATHGAWIETHNPNFAPDISARFSWAKTLTESDEIMARAAQLQIKAKIQAWFTECDLLLLPTTPGAAPLLNATASALDTYRTQLMGLTALAGLAGLPQLHLPVLGDATAPEGISLLGKPGCDQMLLSIARQLI